eukprot:TRINITY_DN32875_c1_g3_i1.p2 TRINITY_DN32875_c1_g3~~TRINITY_DN32875_c1_g3_i1.p2  ORF type:complete len:413 (-),score=20.47 TRINITY_DN32875_c1_g3_i1:152-1390(-)
MAVHSAKSAARPLAVVAARAALTVSVTVAFLLLASVSTVSARALVEIPSAAQPARKGSARQSQARLLPTGGQAKDIAGELIQEASEEASSLSGDISSTVDDLAGTTARVAPAVEGGAAETAEEVTAGVAAAAAGAVVTGDVAAIGGAVAAGAAAEDAAADDATAAAAAAAAAESSARDADRSQSLDSTLASAEAVGKAATAALGAAVAERAADVALDTAAAVAHADAQQQRDQSQENEASLNDPELIWTRCVDTDQLGLVCASLYVDSALEPPVLSAQVALRNHTFVVPLAGAVACVNDQLLLTLLMHDPDLAAFAKEIKAIMIAEKLAAADVISECVLFNGLHVSMDPRGQPHRALHVAACPRLSSHIGCVHSRCLIKRDRELGCFNAKVPLPPRAAAGGAGAGEEGEAEE